MRPPLLHSRFFSSLKQVEKRLKSENNQSTSTDHLSSPIYLNYYDQTPNTTTSTHQDNTHSEPPQEFLSESPQFPSTQKNPSQSNVVEHNQMVNEEEDDIKRLIEHLGLLEFREEEEEQRKVELENLKSRSCFSQSGFYSKIVGVKGPKCEKEMERLDGWIKYYLSDKDGEGERMEPLRLVHLLLGKAAACVSEKGEEGGFGEFEFPSTIEEFLVTDPPN